MQAALAKDYPEQLIESGPAGGAAAAGFLSNLVGHDEIVSTDMGGTSFDVCLIEQGRGLIRDDYEIEWDMPIVTPMLPGFERHLGAGDAIFIERTPESLRAALQRLLDDPELRRSLGRRGQAVAERSFGIDAFVDAYEELYLEAMGATASTI